MPLGQKQELFARLLGVFLQWFHGHLKWRMRIQEGYVGLTDGADGDHDGPHMSGGAHYNKLGLDFALFIQDERGIPFHVTSHHPVWDEIGAFWTALHPLCRWGGNFPSRDYNHISLYHEGKA
jgi:hypothetical protein